MQPTDIPGFASTTQPAKRKTLWQHIQDWDGELSVAKGLTIVTLLAGFFGGYFQYLNAYEEKVSAQAQADMQAATSAFVDISDAFAGAQMLQQLLVFDYLDALGTTSDPGDNKMVTDAARGIFPDYVKARTGLRQNANVFARKAEIYIDWASDLDRDPAAPRGLELDPLNETLLGNYNFDCDAPANRPHFETSGEPDDADKAMACAAGSDQKEMSRGSKTVFCALNNKGQIGVDEAKLRAVTINWQSAKHQLLTMHYCFERAHDAIETARIWASNNAVGVGRENDFRDRQADIKSALDSQVIRLNAFMGLAMAQLERIRIKYQPSGLFCHVPLVRDAIGLVSRVCTPIRIAANR
jgi:hypothetical protein